MRKEKVQAGPSINLRAHLLICIPQNLLTGRNFKNQIQKDYGSSRGLHVLMALKYSHKTDLLKKALPMH